MKSAMLYGAKDLRIIEMPEPPTPAGGQVRVLRCAARRG